MIFSGNYLKEEAEDVEDVVMNKDANTAEGSENIAKEVEDAMAQTALESVSFFEGGEEALDEFYASPEFEVMTEARKYVKKTFVRISKDDDLKRRVTLAAIIIGRETKDPLYKRMVMNKAKYKKDKKALVKKNYNKALSIAKKSQVKHMKDMRKMPALPSFNKVK